MFIDISQWRQRIGLFYRFKFPKTPGSPSKENILCINKTLLDMINSLPMKLFLNLFMIFITYVSNMYSKCSSFIKLSIKTRTFSFFVKFTKFQLLKTIIIFVKSFWLGNNGDRITGSTRISNKVDQLTCILLYIWISSHRLK